MFIKVIKKEDKVYYILCVCDSKTKVWVEHFITEATYRYLREAIKVKEK